MSDLTDLRPEDSGFDVHVPNDVTAKALAKSQAGQYMEEFESVEDLFISWES